VYLPSRRFVSVPLSSQVDVFCRVTINTKRVVVGGLCATAAIGHVVYPVALALRAARRKPPAPPRPSRWPGVTVIVAAYREREVIREKVADLLLNEYPGEIHVIVAADDPDTAAAARGTPATVLEAPHRLGKALALNRAVSVVETPIVVFTDANALFEKGSIEALARWFDDATVAGVAGEKVVSGSHGEGAYWKFESVLKRLESKTGGTLGLVGEIAAVRLSDFRPIPSDVVADDLWIALDLLETGKRIVYEPTARSVEPTGSSLSSDWERRTRIVAGTLSVLWRRRTLLVRSPIDYRLQLWGHRLIRSSFGPLAHVSLLLIAVREMRTSRLATAFLALHVIGGATFVRRRPSKAEMIVRQMLFLQAVALGGIARWLMGEGLARWPKPERLATESHRS